MPRIDTRRSAPQTYAPAPIPAPSSTPEERLRAIWEEFDRLSQYLAGLTVPPPAITEDPSDADD
jgi:hypothetical protein